MWRSVPGRGGGSKVSTANADSLDTDNDAVAEKTTKSLRGAASDQEAVWIRKGYVVAAAALLSVFLISGFLTAHSTTLTSPTVLSYLRTFNTADDASGTDLEDSTSADLDTELQHEMRAELQGEVQSEVQSEVHRREGCNERDAILKVFMYDLPPKFHYGMIEDSQHSWPRNVSSLPHYPGGLYQQHSPEYWLVSDLLTSDMPDRTSPCTAYRVRDWQSADILLVPFFSSLSYNKFSRRKDPGMDLNKELQTSLVSFLDSQPAWRARAADHVLITHHPNSMALMRSHFRPGMFIVADFGRYGSEAKDVVAPYKHVIPCFASDAGNFHERPTLLFFQGGIQRKQGGVIRKQLHALLGSEPDVKFLEGATTSTDIRSATGGMRGSKFCLHLAGDTPSSNRLFDAVASHCVPLVVSDEIELPFEDVLDYSEFCVFVQSRDALRKGFLVGLLRGFAEERWRRMHRRLREVERHFEWRHPTERGDAVHMTWEAVARKVPGLQLARHKRRRYERSRSPAGVGHAM